MKKLLKIVIILIIIGIICGIGVYIYVFHKPQRNLANEKPSFTLNANDLIKQFSEKEDSSFKVFGNKAIQVNGIIADITKKDNLIQNIVLENSSSGVSCNFDSLYSIENSVKIAKFKLGDSIILKGKCDGYDMLMGVVLSRCCVVEKEK
jgi:hypothetical protein